MERDLFGFLIGFVIATITSPVGVSGAVFLLPVQLSVFGVPNPQVTPTTSCTTCCPDQERCCGTHGKGSCAGRWLATS